MPSLYLVRDDLGPRLEQFAAAGGTVLVTFFSGIADEHDHIRLGGYPAPLPAQPHRSAVDIHLLGPRQEALTGQTYHEALTLPPHGVAVLAES